MFHAVLTCNQIWFTMSLLGAQLEEFQGGIFIPDEETLIYCVKTIKCWAQKLFLLFYRIPHVARLWNLQWDFFEICDWDGIYVVANVQIQLMYTLAS